MFNCPLIWRKYNERKYKLFIILAAQLLSIPATSAPSDHIFSVAGLTISKDRARIASDVANIANIKGMVLRAALLRNQEVREAA